MSGVVAVDLEILHLYVSPGHNFFGRYGRDPAEHPTLEVREFFCTAGRGVRGDRFFDYKEGYKGQITFFADEVYRDLCRLLGVENRGREVFRRNVITRGIDLNELIGQRFSIDGVEFAGKEECRPCSWMDYAFAPGAEAALRGRGGLRATILCSGVLRAGCSSLRKEQPDKSLQPS